MIAKPFSPGNAFPAEEVARERLTFDKAMIGSCTNGSYDDLLSAALVLVAARAQGLTKAQGPDALESGQRAITSFNRNWQNRMGLGGEGYLASPSVVAASALVGYMAPPSELGLKWDPERYGV